MPEPKILIGDGMPVSGIGPNFSVYQGNNENVDSRSEAVGGQGLTEEEKQRVAELKKRDAEVRAHEAAHVAAGGRYVRGAASFEYESGPDGKKYAVGGEVSIDTSAVSGDPQATIQKMRTVRAAALAPASPSGQDRAVAAAAAAAMAEAQQDKQAESKAEIRPDLQGLNPETSNTVNSIDQKIKSSDRTMNSYTAHGKFIKTSIKIPEFDLFI